MVGRRWNVDLTEPWDFSDLNWSNKLLTFTEDRGTLYQDNAIDYFVFPRDSKLIHLPPFAVGRPRWDNYLLFRCRQLGYPLIDATEVITAIHQNHDYAYLKRGPAAIHKEKEIRYNSNLGNGSGWHYYAANAATRQLVDGKLRSNPLARLGPIQRLIVFGLYSTWFSFLKITRPIRHPLGLRRM
jgi:hypothetical protein